MQMEDSSRWMVDQISGSVRDRARRGALRTALLVAGTVFSAPAFAQTIAPVERNLPPVVTGQGRLMIGPQDIAGSSDATPLVAQLSGITLIGTKDNLARKAKRGIRIGAIGETARPALEQALAPFVGQPLSRKLIGEIQAAIAKVYREAGYPFVSVTLPPQEVTSGVLTLRVVEFRIGSVKVSGAADGMEAHFVRRVRAVPGERIAADALDEDLAWLNRYPYHVVNGVFSPGNELGLSTLNLEVTEQKPWQVFGGWSNTGTHGTGFDRYYAGFGAALVGVPQSFFSYQVTGSPDFWSNPGNVGAGSERPNYYSQAGRLAIATGARQGVEIAPSYVSTRQRSPNTPFAYDSTVLEIPVIYRTAISNLVPDLYAGDLILGGAAKTISRGSYFTGIDIGGARAELFQMIVGWSATKFDAYGLTSLEVRAIANLGGVLGGNAGTQWSEYSGGRVTDVNYVYGTVDLSRVTRLSEGFNWVSNVAGVAAGQPLPDTEQMSLSGLQATRGYTLDDSKVDTGVVWRNELRTPTFAALAAAGVTGVSDQVSPYAFLDVSWGRAYGYEGLLGTVPRFDSSLAGVGVGFDYTLNRNVTASLAAGYAMRDALYTRQGDVNVQARVYVSY